MGTALVVLCASGVVALLVSNAIIARTTERKLASLTGLHWTVDAARWSPWGGIRLCGIVADVPGDGQSLPSPLCEVAEVRIEPYWRTVFRERPRFRTVEVRDPRGEVPLELLATLTRTAGRPEKVAGVPPRVAAPVPPGDQVDGTTGQAASRAVAEGEVDPGDGGSSKQPEGAAVPTQPTVRPDPLPSEILVSGGRLRIYSLSHPQFELLVKGIACDLPVRGPEADGSVSIAHATLGSRSLTGPVRAKVAWDGRTLVFDEVFRAEGGFEFSVAARVLPSRAPRMNFLAAIRSPSLPVSELPELAGTQFGIERIESAFLSGGGFVARPETWQADCLVDTRGILFGNPGWGGAHRFDHGRMVAQVRRGVLRIPDARLRSEQFSLLGNGILLADGRHWSVVRVVSDEETARVIRRLVVGSKVSGGATTAWMQPLGIPDRRYRDILLQGTIPGISADLGNEGEQVPVTEAITLLRAFLDRKTGGAGQTAAFGNQEA